MSRAVISYWILTLGVVVGANAFLARSPIYERKTEIIDANYAALDGAIGRGAPFTLVIGNSYVAATFRGHLPDGMQSFMEPGMPLENIVQLVENLPPASPVSRILVGLGYTYANPVPSSGETYRMHFATNPVSRAWWSLPLVRGRTLGVRSLKEGLNCQLRGKDCPRERVVTSGAAEVFGLKAEADMARSVKDRLRQYRPLMSSLSPRLEPKLIRLASACEARGITLYAYTAPIHPDLRRALDASVLDAFGRAVAQAVSSYRDFNLDAEGWGDELFHDATHLNAAGAARTRELLFAWMPSRSDVAGAR